MGVIIGTAGHVDHGKTELIKSLTGIDTDRLAEEKRRGLSIELGFAFIDLPKSGRVGIVDVPGHQRFLKNMLAGVGGIDVGLLVVAADEGVMPQTKEHFEIMRLVKVKKIVVALTKIDLVDEEIVETSMLDVKELLENTPYAESQILKLSSITGEGLSELKQGLDEIVCALPVKESSGFLPVLPIDRVFVLKGTGVVITGSLISGTINEGEEVFVWEGGELKGFCDKLIFFSWFFLFFLKKKLDICPDICQSVEMISKFQMEFYTWELLHWNVGSLERY